MKCIERQLAVEELKRDRTKMPKKNESESKSEQPKRKPKYNEEQYQLLISCSGNEDITEWNQYRKEHPSKLILLQGAYFDRANLQGAKLVGANLQRAILAGAHLENADLWGAAIQDADFSRATVDGKTLIWDCKINRKTNFEGVGLGSIRIHPRQRQLLEYNIRRKNWEEWYTKGCWWQRILKRLFIWTFWLISDYGLSTWRIILTFFGLAVVFAVVYYFVPSLVANLHVTGNNVLDFIRACYFSIVTMTTLGFGDMYANRESWAGHILLIVQVLLGYILLAALVTRFAVLFTAGGPAGEFTKKTVKKDGGVDRKEQEK